MDFPLQLTPEAQFTTDSPGCGERCWDAVCSRDRRADGSFVYAVKTTGIYCRPSCGARPPKRENVLFFAAAQFAAAVGFRPCKRCGPDDSLADPQHCELVLRACRAIASSESHLPLARLAAEAGFSPHHFHRVFKEVTGLTPGAFRQAVRARRMEAALQSEASVTAAIYEAGYGSPARFYAQAAARLGMAPASFRRGAPGERIRYSVAPCFLGVVLIAATERGVCAIEFGDAADALVEGLRGRFPNAHLAPADDAFSAWIDAVLRYLDHPQGLLDLPLDIQGTVFQWRVWRALQTIPAGQTVSYAELARRLGQEGAHRAVARACASNPVAVAIPCHRVLGSDGRLTGYRWGIDRKAALLRREGEP
jgi:AraC family transcriptional regulator, regulatory protein of adaptative response / methylated-DNA-[protein]-cysteine methyltransferase